MSDFHAFLWVMTALFGAGIGALVVTVFLLATSRLSLDAKPRNCEIAQVGNFGKPPP